MTNKPDFGEPWTFDTGIITDRHGSDWHIGTLFGTYQTAIRAVAAINAVRGIPTENLADGIVGEMVEALRGMVNPKESHQVAFGRVNKVLAKLGGDAVTTIKFKSFYGPHERTLNVVATRKLWDDGEANPKWEWELTNSSNRTVLYDSLTDQEQARIDYHADEIYRAIMGLEKSREQAAAEDADEARRERLREMWHEKARMQ